MNSTKISFLKPYTICSFSKIYFLKSQCKNYNNTKYTLILVGLLHKLLQNKFSFRIKNPSIFKLVNHKWKIMYNKGVL